MRVAIVQFDTIWESPAENHVRAERRAQEAVACGAQLVVFPEMFATGFSMRPERTAEHDSGPTHAFLSAMAADLGVHIIAGVATQTPDRRFENHAVHAAPDGARAHYSKIHPFSFANEHEHYTPGSTVATWDIAGLRITPFICYDLRFPEPFRLAADDTDLYVVIANWPERRRAHWQTLLRARAIENLAFVAGVNRVGDGDGLHYAGDSAVISPWGETLVGAAEHECVLTIDVDAAATPHARAKFPALKDRRGPYTR